MSHSGGKLKASSKAKHQGTLKKRRRRRAERRETLKPLQEVVNARMRAAGHPGWQ